MANYYDRFDKVAIFDTDGKHVEDVDANSNDGDHGIPDKYFEGDANYAFVYLDTRTGFAEWIPGVGPAPCYQNDNGANIPREELYREVEKFVEENY